MSKLTDFTKGIIAGFLGATIIYCAIAANLIMRERDREVIEYVGRQQAIEEMREDGFLRNLVNRDPYEFIETMPGVSGAVDGAAADFLRKRDEILERFRSRMSSRARLTN